jgi:type IV pilus assembly protein PilX
MRKERGAILITALLLLLVLTILGTSSLQNTVLQERMAGNMNNRNLAFQASEAALREAEEWLGDRVQLPAEKSGGLGDNDVWRLDAPDPGDGTHFWWKASEAGADWWQNGDNTREVDSFCNDDCLVAENPRYLIEHRLFRPDSLVVGQAATAPAGKDYHRITARGVGRTTKAKVVLQSVFVRRYD